MELEDRMTMAGAEGIDLDLVLAGVASRGAALIIDLVLQFLTLSLVLAVASSFDAAGVAAAAIGSFLVLLGYPILAEAFNGGRTVGKMLLKISVVTIEGTPITFLQATIRNVVRLVDSLPGVYLIGIVAVLLTKRAQRVGDLAAGTLVVHQGRPGSRTAVAGDAWAVSAGPPPDADGWDLSAVTPDEVAAVRSFLARRTELDPQHRADLAQTLAFQLLPKVAGVPLEGGPEVFLERVAAAKAAR